MKKKTKMARNLYEQLKQQAKEVEDKENIKLYVSETVTKKTREKVKEIVRKAAEMIICDEELGLITEDEASEEIAIEKLIYKSL